MMSGPPIILSLFLSFLLEGSHAFLTPSQQTPPSYHAANKDLSLSAIKSPLSSETSEASGQNVFGVLSDKVTGMAFDVLHAFDDDPIQDSSKNLRVLWVRALLNQKGLIDDPVAATFLPPTTRGLVTTDTGASLFNPIVQFTEWIQARTDFIEDAVQHFLSSPECSGDKDESSPKECNIVLFGAGYDTRAIRYRNAHGSKINFIEVDLPEVTGGKRKLYEKFQRTQDPDWNLGEQHNLVPLDLNSCGDEDGVGLLDTLQKVGGLNKDLPTLFVWEAVLFYVNEDAVRNIMTELTDFTSSRTNSMLCFTDSLKPFVDVPFSNEVSSFFRSKKLELLQHRSRWGGAVHFCLIGTKKSPLAQHISSRVGGIVNSYTPTQSNNPKMLKKPSFDNVWYAVAYPWQIDGYETPLEAALNKHKTVDPSASRKPFATRLWGEPVVIYRDDQGKLVAMADACPHRSVPLSLGKVEEGELVCMYHGWRFGQDGQCVDVPTLKTTSPDDEKVKYGEGSAKFLKTVTSANCGNHRAVVEHEGLVYMWRGNLLEADPSLLPTRRKGDMETVPIDTVLDYAVDYSYIVENNLDSPHLFYLHDGSVPPIESIGMINSNLPKLKLQAFTDDCGMGHLGRLGRNGRPKKILRFDPPNIVRHGGVSGFEEEFHICPIAPQRTRVLLRQHLPRGPILSTLTQLPGMVPMLTLIVNNWNYHIALEDSCVMQGQASRIEDWGMPRMNVGGLGDDLIKRFWMWRAKAHENYQEKHGDLASPYLNSLLENAGSKGGPKSGIPTGTSFGDAPDIVQTVRRQSQLQNRPLVTDEGHKDWKGQAVGSWGIKQNYLQETPAANFPPINYQSYAKLLVFDDLVKNTLLKQDKVPAETIDNLPAPDEFILRPPPNTKTTTSKTKITLEELEEASTTPPLPVLPDDLEPIISAAISESSLRSASDTTETVLPPDLEEDLEHIVSAAISASSLRSASNTTETTAAPFV